MINYFILFVFVFLSNQTNSSIYQCESESGDVEFKDLPCEKKSKETYLSDDINERGFLKIYFNSPNINGLKPNCGKYSCYCGSSKIRLKSDSESQLLSSAKKIPSLVYYFNRQYKEYKTNKRIDNRLRASACELYLHQSLFDKNYHSYEDSIEKTKISKSKIKYIPVKCGSEPIISDNETHDDFRYRYIKYESCLRSNLIGNDYPYRKYIENKEFLIKIESAFSRLRVEYQ